MIIDPCYSCIEQKKSANVFVSGQPGTGKTLCVSHVIDELQNGRVSIPSSPTSKAPKGKSNVSIKSISTNAMSHTSPKELFAEISKQIPVFEKKKKMCTLSDPISDLLTLASRTSVELMYCLH